jgi:hypothetical protein
VKTAKIRLFSPQSYFKEAELGSLYVDFQRTELTLHDGSILTFPFADNNIPYMLPDWQPIVGITLEDSSTLTIPVTVNMSVAEESNQNLTASQKELLTWRWKMGHCHLDWIQRLASVPRAQRRRVIHSKFPISTAHPPYCAACALSKFKARKAPGTVDGKARSEMKIRAGDLQPGDFVSVDQYVYGSLSLVVFLTPWERSYQSSSTMEEPSSLIMLLLSST